jgi:mRNA-degrading endonuclease RelE of RelBE toxin-antitoxin system
VNPDRYALHLSAGARRTLTEGPPVGLPPAVAAAVLEFITGALLDNPHRVGGQLLLGPLRGRHSARRGAYRVIYTINDTARTVTVSRIDHRATAYRA